MMLYNKSISDRMKLSLRLGLLLTTLLLFCSPTANYTVLSYSVYLGAYSKMKVKIEDDLLPQNYNFTFKVTTINYTAANASVDPQGSANTDSLVSTSTSSASTPYVVFTSVLVYGLNSSVFTIYNYQTTAQSVSVSLQTTGNISVSQYILVLSQPKREKTFVAIIDDIITNGFMLPFNMLNTKATQLFVLEHQAALTQESYNLAPFTTTYWTQNNSTATVLAWLPYFSQCTYQKRHILLNDILKPTQCRNSITSGLECQQKQMQFQCIIQELEVKSVASEFWFNQITSIPFYFYPTELDYSQIEKLRTNSDNLLTYLITQFHQYLVPVVYQRTSSNQSSVNSFEFNVIMLVYKGQKTTITYAQLIGSYDPTITSPYGTVSVTVSYDLMLSFVYYGLDIKWYILYCFAMVGLLLLIVWAIARKLKISKMTTKIKLMVAPVIKGVGLSLVTAGFFVVVMQLLACYSNYSAIMATFDADYVGEALQFNNIGRFGLTLFITGLYILTSAIKQTFKVNQQEQLKLAFEDDKAKFESEEQLKDKIEFSRTNLFSYRKYLFNGVMLYLAIALFMFFTFSIFSTLSLALLQVLVLPLFSNLFMHFQNEQHMKNHLFSCAFTVSGICLTSYFIMASQNIYEVSYLYICNYVSSMFMMVAFEILSRWLFLRVEAYKQHNSLAEMFCRLFEKRLQAIKTESQYEKALFYSSFNVSILIKIFLYPFLLLFVYLTQNYNQIARIFIITDQSILIPIFLCILGVFLEVYTVLFVTEILKLKFGIRIEETMKYNSFRFSRIKNRWMSDVFSESKYIGQQFKQFQKFVYSSQLYFVISLNAIGLQVILMGLIIMVQIQYLPFYDPVSLIVLVSVWTVGEIFSFLVSVLGVKLKVYEKKGTDEPRQQLAKMQKYLKPDERNQFLQLDGVKSYFMGQEKEWIIKNLHRIFTKEDLKEKNYQLITKYKEYKRNFKRKEIDKKKMQQQLNLISTTQHTHPAITEQPYLVFKSKHIYTVAKPILVYWHCLAKQNLYLKNIVACVKQQKIKPVCEFCNMDIYLQALEKYGFHDIVNAFRVENVGKMFDQLAFLEYYRINQQYVTICLECKEENLHLHTKVDKKSIAAKLMFCWLIAARSNLLHKQKATQTLQ